MILKEISFTNFRNYENVSLSLNEGINILYGNNAQGKTNLLESIYFLALTKSHRSFIDRDLIMKNKDFCNLKGKIIENNIETKLEISLRNKVKKLKVDQTEVKKTSDYISNLNVIIFYPEDLYLIKGAPNERRRFINLELSQLYNNYLNILSDYNKLLKTRNEYLKKIKKEEYDISYFEALNKYFIEKAAIIYSFRKKYIDNINEFCGTIYKNISGMGNFNIIYKPIISFQSYEIENLKKQIEEKIKKTLPIEIKLGISLIGPHRDDFEFMLDDINLKSYGSQGQQRMGVISLKLSEIEIFKKYKKTKPILLLDDVFSELDDEKKNNLLMYINKDIQTIITTTEINNIGTEIINYSKIIKVEQGKLIEEENNGKK